jgi:hypothetical protein
MRSRDELIYRAERALRVAALLALVAAIWAELPRASAPARGRVTLRTAELPGALDHWTATPPSESLHLAADSLPGPAARDWLAALRRAGTAVGWSNERLAAVAVALEKSGDPAGGLRVLVAAPSGATVGLADDLSVLDSSPASAGGAAFRLGAATPGLRVSLGAHRAIPVPPDSLLPRRLVLLARAGWESKFILAVLEERGWEVDARLEVGPGMAVSQGAPLPPDTARHAAVIVLDSLAPAESQRVASFVRSGGGLVLGPEAARSPALAALAPAGRGARVGAATLTFTVSEPRRALSFTALSPLRAGAVVLESRGGRVAAAARRVGAGRVLQLGYHDTWRWRFSGGEDGPEAHRAFWAAVVSAAASRAVVRGRDGEWVRTSPEAQPPHQANERSAESPAIRLRESAPDPAPLPALHASLGEPWTTRSRTPRPPKPGFPRGPVFALLVGSLVIEWASRRLRGAR